MPAQLREALGKAMEKPVTAPTPSEDISKDEFFSSEDLVPVKRNAAKRTLKRVLAEVEELIREKKWEDIAALCDPVDEKHAELAAYGLDISVRAKLGFAFSQMKRFDEAIRELSICVKREPGHFLYRSSLAFSAYNSLFAAANRETFLSGKARAERIELAHRHFRKAQELRPDGVTNFYRQGMLFKKIQDKPELALPLFEEAVSNWENLDQPQKKVRHQERKNYVKSLYQLASALRDGGFPERALNVMKRCLIKDEHTHAVSLPFKYFALGKIHFQLNQFEKARDALVFAAGSGGGRTEDFIQELLARTYLALNNAQRALEVIEKVPEGRRRPYYRWTEADVWCALGNLDRATGVLSKALERDKRSRHKTLMRLAKIAYGRSDFQGAEKSARLADQFFQEKWGNPFYEGCFWQALCAYRNGNHERARQLAEDLRSQKPHYPLLDKLLSRLS